MDVWDKGIEYMSCGTVIIIIIIHVITVVSVISVKSV